LANSKQATKRARQNVKRRAHNMALRSKVRTYIKKVTMAIDAGDKSAATAAMKDAADVDQRIRSGGPSLLIQHKKTGESRFFYVQGSLWP